MGRINAGNRSELQQGLSAATKAMARELAELTGARSQPVIQAATALARAWRLVLNTPAGDVRQSIKSRRLRGSPSAPGQPPHRLSGQTRKSVKTAVVDGVRRVGTGWFKLRLLEDGVTATVTRRRSAKGDFVTSKVGKFRRKRVAKRTGSFTFVIAPRPSAERALQIAAPAMGEVFVTELQRGVAAGGT